MRYNNVEITGLGHASFKVKWNGIVIYIDPYRLDHEMTEDKQNLEQKQKTPKPEDKKFEMAGFILLTHEHYDHCSPEDIRLITDENTLILAPKKAADKLRGNVRVIKPEEKIDLGIMIIETVESYNIDKPFHPKGHGVGFIININNVRIYDAGDTDLIPEMKKIKDIDIALLPVSGVYVMNAEEAAEAADIIKPKVAVPMHYGSIVGNKTDAETFAEQVSCQVMLLSQKECKPGDCDARGDE